MKKHVVIGVSCGLIGLAALTAWLSSGWASRQLSRPAAAQACPADGQRHEVAIRQDHIIPEHTVAQRCDQLIITNYDDKLRLISFGEHDHHIPYAGVSETTLAQSQSLKLTLSQTGTYLFHDHYQDEVAGSFSVQ